MPEIGHPQSAGRGGRRLGQRRQGQPVHLRRQRAVPAQPGAVRPAAPGGRLPGEAAQPGEQGPRRCGHPGCGGREPDRGAQQVDGEVGGELDRRLQLGVHRAVDDRGRSDDGGGHDGGRGRDGGADGPVGSVPEPVDPQRGRPPGEVRSVVPGTPAGEAPADRARAGPHRRPGGRNASRVDAEHADGQPDGEPDDEVRAAVHLRGPRRAGAEQAEGTGNPGGDGVGLRNRGGLDRHVLPSREVGAAVGEGTAGKEKSRDDDARGPAPGTSRSDRVTEPLRNPCHQADDPHPGPVTCRQPAAKAQLNTGNHDR
jgi:hypothetical protein